MRTDSSAPLTHHLRRAGVFVASGYGIKISVRRGQLVVEDGVGRGRRTCRFSRATHGISRFVVIGSDGFVSLDAIRWLDRLGIAFIHLDRDGAILVTSTPHGGDARLRRLQATIDGDASLELARMLLQAKVDGQGQVLEALLPQPSIRESFRTAVVALAQAERIEQLVWAERDAALAYWSAWSRVRFGFSRRDEGLVPEHWLEFGKRGSLLSNSPRLAINPANAILNYLYAILEAETRLACLKLGLDPGLGVVHVDHQNRDSFALDLMEAARPSVDTYLLELVQNRTFRRSDFAETPRGICRISLPLSHELAETAPHWAAAIAPAAEAAARLLAHSEASRVAKVSTPLTGRNRLARYGSEPRLPRLKTPTMNGTCKDCGGLLPRRGRVYCDDCLPTNSQRGSGLSATEWTQRKGHDPTHGATASIARATSNVARKREAREWDQKHGKLVDLSSFEREILPLIRGVPLSRLQKATGLSLRYVSLIRRGERVPHPRHWQALLEAAAST
jgi:CRISPR-associated endonuclease Cas1